MILVVAGVSRSLVSVLWAVTIIGSSVKAWFGSSAYAVVPLQMTVVVRSATTSALLLKFFFSILNFLSLHFYYWNKGVSCTHSLWPHIIYLYLQSPKNKKVPSALRQKVLNSLIKNKRSQQHYLTVSRSSKVIIRQFFWLKFIIHPSLPRQIPVAYFGRTHFYSDGIVRALHPASLLRPTSPDNINMHLFASILQIILQCNLLFIFII